MLGGACTYISLAASYFTGVNIVAVVGEVDHDHIAARRRRIEGSVHLSSSSRQAMVTPAASLMAARMRW